jgi:ABC-type polysaccharide/polyol phosphate transport system ATPase subunit
MTSSEPTNNLAIEAQNVSVLFRSYEKRPTSLKEGALAFLRTGNLKYYSTFEALSNLSFSVQRGRTLGIIGSNGAGKSTLLRVLSGVLPPSQGVLRVNGSVDSLIHLGAGFDADLTARENIFLYSSLHGRPRHEIEARVEGILDFAELREFSNTPIKYFSSGMAARLGFSCAVDIDPDILLVDEVLAVGDERFSHKCRDLLKGFKAKGKTIIMVSHAIDDLAKECDEMLVLSKGTLLFWGPPAQALAAYRDPTYATRLK